MNDKHTYSLSSFSKIKLALVAGLVLFIGFITSMFLLTISIILLPFAAIKLWLLQKRSNRTEPINTNTSHSQIYEGEYTSL